MSEKNLFGEDGLTSNRFGREVDWLLFRLQQGLELNKRLKLRLEQLLYWCAELQDNNVISEQSTFWEEIDKTRALLAEIDQAQIEEE